MNSTPVSNEWLIIINPNAGKGKGLRDKTLIADLMTKAGLTFEMQLTGAKGHAAQIARSAVTGGYRKILTVGGDGTLNEVVNGVFNQDRCSTTEITLGLIPVGTGNDWGRMFDIPLDHKKAVEIIAGEKKMLHDIGYVNYLDGNETKKRYFINIAGLGFESVVVRRTNIQKEKGRGGKLIYFYNLLMSLLSYKNTEAEIIVDGTSKKASVFSVNVGNGRFCGGGMRQTPDAIPDDGWLDVTVINGIGKPEIIRNLKILYNGKILQHPKIDGYRCKNLKVTSDGILWTEADGESLGRTPAEFGIIPGAINIVYGKRLIP